MSKENPLKSHRQTGVFDLHSHGTGKSLQIPTLDAVDGKSKRRWKDAQTGTWDVILEPTNPWRSATKTSYEKKNLVV